jgi:hypothetical protein
MRIAVRVQITQIHVFNDGLQWTIPLAKCKRER